MSIHYMTKLLETKIKSLLKNDCIFLSCNPHLFPFRLLVQQLVEPVCWPTLILNMQEGKTMGQIYEVGPGRQLKAMLQRIDPRLVQHFTNVEA